MSHHVVIADDDVQLLRILSCRLQGIGFKVDEARDGFAANLGLFVAGDPKDLPDLIILDVNMPSDDGLSICEELLHDEHLADVPVIVLTGRSDRGTIQRCRELGVHYVHKSGDVWKKLEPLVRSLAPLENSDPSSAAPAGGERERPSTAVASSPQPREAICDEANDEGPAALLQEPRTVSRVLVVDDDRNLTDAIEVRLKACGFEVQCAATCADGFHHALKERPDAIITDYVMPDAYGNYLVRRLREHPLTKRTPIIVLTGCDLAGRPTDHADYSLERQFFNLGAEVVLRKPFDHRVLVAELEHCIRGPRRQMSPAALLLQ